MSKLDAAPMGYSFDDFTLEPRYSEVKSRRDPDLSVNLKNFQYDLPVVSSPMNTVTETDMLVAMHKLGGVGVLHRYLSIESQVKIVEQLMARLSDPVHEGPAKSCYPDGTPVFWVAVGANGDFTERVTALSYAGVTGFCVDVANGHNELSVQAVRAIRRLVPEARIMAGNVCTFDGAYRLAEAGANSIRVGIGSGSVCTTRLVTGHGIPQLSAIEDCARIKYRQDLGWLNGSTEREYSKAYPDIAIIADGGVRKSGDVVKSLAMGADAVMLGNLLAGTEETPGEWLDEGGVLYKYYHGMACYSQDTEMLTIDGWKNVSKVNIEDKIATLNPKTKELEYQTPVKIHEYAYNGEMVGIKSRFVDLLVTPNHKLYAKKRKSDKDFGLIEAENVYGTGMSMFKGCNWVGEKQKRFILAPDKSLFCGRTYKGFNVPMAEWLDFFGFWLAEGCCGNGKNYSVSISNNDKNIIDHYYSMIKSWNIGVYVRKRENNYELTFNNLTVAKHLRQFGKAHEKYIPKEIKSLNKENLEILLNGIMLGDGCVSRGAIYSASTQLRDDIWEIAFKCGRPASISINHESGTSGTINGRQFTRKNAVWAVGRLSSKLCKTSVAKKNWNTTNYNGTVHCVEVPNHIVCVRRNNKHVWCGNSDEARAKWKGQVTGVPAEGVSKKIMYSGRSAVKVVETLCASTRVGLSFSGAMNVADLREKARWRRVSPAGYTEGTPHGQ